MLWPKPLIRLGELDPDELRNFPVSLKRRLAISLYLIIIGMALLFLMLIVLELIKN
ncbi:hypothetical protein D3C87_1890220 [compost metagenome]